MLRSGGGVGWCGGGRSGHAEQRAVMAAQTGHPPLLREVQEVQEVPESHRAGHFAHVAHMNVFHPDSAPFRIPAKICPVTLSAEGAHPPGLRDKKINASDSARESDICAKLIEQVKLDMRLSDGDNKTRPENSTTSSSLAKEKGKSGGRQEEKKMEARKDGDDDEQWAKAKEKVEEFLDFPGAMAALAHRNQGKSSQNASKNSKELVNRGQPDPLPNTRHNAIFLRDHEKAAEAILRNPHQKGKQSQAVDSHQSNPKSRDHSTKKVEKSNSHVDSIVAESNTGTER